MSPFQLPVKESSVQNSKRASESLRYLIVYYDELKGQRQEVGKSERVLPGPCSGDCHLTLVLGAPNAVLL